MHSAHRFTPPIPPPQSQKKAGANTNGNGSSTSTAGRSVGRVVDVDGFNGTANAVTSALPLMGTAEEKVAEEEEEGEEDANAAKGTTAVAEDEKEEARLWTKARPRVRFFTHQVRRFCYRREGGVGIGKTIYVRGIAFTGYRYLTGQNKCFAPKKSKL